MKERKQLILNSISDLVSNFLYYDRKEDEDLPRDAIDESVRNGEISTLEITNEFHKQLKKGLEL